MRALIMTAGAALLLSACSGGADSQANNDMNAMTADNMAMDQNMTDLNMVGENGAMAGPGGMDGNIATNASTENAMMNKDMHTNDPDTNLANGM